MIVEDQLAQPCIIWFVVGDYESLHSPDIAADGAESELTGYQEERLLAFHFPPLLFVLMVLIVFYLLKPSAVVAANRLVNASSPYLLQHVDDLVDWQPWSAEALQQAQRQDKLIFLSIGYSSCHWCHKMGRDSFSDPQVASFLNAHYVSILVDREERPDLDSYYMQVAEAMNGEGGWPLNVVLTPKQLPLFASSYLPPRRRFGLTGLQTVLEGIHNAWTQDRATLLRDETVIWSQLQALLTGTNTDANTDASMAVDKAADGVDPRDIAVRYWMAQRDSLYGGFGTAAKFLHPEVLSMLLRRSVQTGDATLADAVYFSLDRMAAGGVRDQLGGAFHRYSADRFWQVPHFEIMLYDNALMARVYMEAYQLSARSRYAFVARQILDDMLDRFWLPDGGFAAALDADSRDAEGQSHEGFFYLWTPAEIISLVGEEGSRSLLATFLDPLRGSVDGRAILRLQANPEQLLEQHRKLAPLLLKLAQARRERSMPHRDEKVITSWNSLAVSALAQAARVFADRRYLNAAQAGITDLLTRPWQAGKLRHSRHGSRVGEALFLDDYAFLLQSLLDLYETTFDLVYLERARQLATDMFACFQADVGRADVGRADVGQADVGQADVGQALQLLPLGHAAEIANQVQLVNQHGIPSGNAVALSSLARLSLFMWDEAFQDKVATVLRGLRGFLLADGYLAPELLRALDFQAEFAREVIIVGPAGADATHRLVHEVHKRFLPGTIIARVDPANQPDAQRWPMLANRPMLANKPTAYVCVKALCKQPLTKPEELAHELDPSGSLSLSGELLF